ncbi:Starch-binding associating with outer membrane [Mariniphaga anaerophila]|uniref:Starch-binding associating with outer membrane n=1 Tax=Mariniphaga anaerophila TaxID=1484053 RepID=A0A1M5FCX6_9BACT|nr:RagB/SusD family nutrient uptake outer membrane protein [Mariniphaga anaerophila]SHF89385.1 Starch-binding associating with outer membrane [Mariniphaga anaerophila]
MKTKIKYILFIAISVIVSACSDLLEENTYTFIAGEDLVDNKNYDQLVAGAYNPLNYGFEWGNYHTIVNFDCDYQSGPTWAFGTIGAGNFYENSSNTNFYNYYYIAIHRANYHKSLIEQMDIDEKVKSNAMGELAFLKAWSYFNLVQFYGDLCLYKVSIAEGADLYKPRSPIKDVYEHIIEELKYAEEAMFSTQDPQYTIGHVSSGAAKALLAKVYATIASASMPSGQISVMGGPGHRYDEEGIKIFIPVPQKLTFEKSQVAGYESFNSQEYFKLAMDKAKEVIQSNDFYLYPSQQELWAVASKNRGEFIFTLQTIPGSTETSNFVATDYAGYYTENGTLSSGYYVQRDHWYQLFDENDGRARWGVIHRVPIDVDNEGNLIYSYYPAKDSVKVRLGTDGYSPSDILRYDAHLYGSKLTKFRQVSVPLDGSRTDFNFPFMRYAEVILLYAEAANEVNGGPTPDALLEVEKLNIRNNSTKVTDIGQTRPWTQESFRSYILEERAKEFAGEGLRRFDLLRWGIYLQTMNAIDVDEKDVVKRRQDRHLLLPLPANEINTNPLIETNNPGW